MRARCEWSCSTGAGLLLRMRSASTPNIPVGTSGLRSSKESVYVRDEAGES